MDKKNILYIGGFELPDKNAAAHRVLNNAKILRELGYEVTFIGVSKSIDGNDIKKSMKTVQGFNTWSIPYPKKTKDWIRHISEIKNIKTIITDTNKEFNIVVCYNFPSFAYYKLLKYCKRHNIKLISDCTEWYDHKINSIVGLIKHIDSEFRMMVLNRRCDGVICISKYLFDYYKKVQNKIILPPLVDLQDEKWRSDITDKSEIKKLVYAGSPGLNKDKINFIIDIMLSIDSISEKIRFDVIGISRDEYIRDYSMDAKEMSKIDKFVKFHGKIPHLDAINIIKNADFSVFIRESIRVNMAGFPTKFVESISCGTPIITNKTSDLEQYLVEGKNGYWITIEEYEKSIIQFKDILKLSKYDIEKMKQECKSSKMFDYRNYKDLLENFLSLVNN